MSNERISREDLLFGVSLLFAKRSTCLRGQVGCVIAKEGRIIATGYNGPLGGTEHCNSENCDLDKACEHALHAEANAIAFSAKKGIALEGSVLWCTHGPCKKCAELIVQAGVIEVNYLKPYRSSEGVNLLIKNQIIVRGYEED